MKILAWLLFGTSCALFTACFCRQQLDVAQQQQDAYAAYPQASENWRIMTSDESADAPEPSTRPAASESAVAATDLGDATK